MNIMEEQVRNEINKASEKLEMEVSIVEEKYFEICKTNNLDPSSDMLLALSLFRQWFSGTYQYKDAPAQETGGGFIKKATGYFLSVNEPMDMGARLNTQIHEQYSREPTTTYDSGRVAVATATSEDKFVVSRTFDGEVQEKVVDSLPENHIEVDSGQWIIPLDNISAYGERKNPNYGKPLPASQTRMQGVFLGEVDGEEGMYYFSYKGEASKKFTPRTFRLLQFDCIRDSITPNRIYGFKTGTLESLKMNADLTDDTRVAEPGITDMQNYTMEHAMANYSPLIDLNRYHASVSDRNFAEKFVITDGAVTHIDATPNKIGSRRITITDVNADYNYEAAGWEGTTCWVPQHLHIDFGINSSVLVVGRTSQGRNEDGSMRDVSLNLSGILCVNNMGVIAEPFEAAAEEEDLDWF